VTPKLPTATAKDLVRVAERLGFVFRRQRGSHAIYVRQSDQARVVIPMHKGELKRKTLPGAPGAGFAPGAFDFPLSASSGARVNRRRSSAATQSLFPTIP
jgi:predicted RNA binding protein YcfA (HicA-like mRNA interferase family)